VGFQEVDVVVGQIDVALVLGFLAMGRLLSNIKNAPKVVSGT
jgi:hypothetical protein